MLNPDCPSRYKCIRRAIHRMGGAYPRKQLAQATGVEPGPMRDQRLPEGRGGQPLIKLYENISLRLASVRCITLENSLWTRLTNYSAKLQASHSPRPR
jgi:hypothetical protein